MSVSVRLEGMAEARKAIAQMTEKAKEAVRAEVAASAHELRTQAIKYVSDHGITNLGDLVKMMYAEVDSDGMTAEVGNRAKHAVFVHDGTSPHMPPVDAIAAWAQRKLGLDADEARSVGFAIALHIKENGTKANPFLQVPAEQMANEFPRRITSAVRSATGG